MLKPAAVRLYNRVNNEDQDLGFPVSPKVRVSSGMVRALHPLPWAVLLVPGLSNACGRCLWP